ncbi:MAG: sugar transferase [Chloroflexota bacterium]|nr:sugar transferase [Chloroflexota bacterium]
MMTVGTSQQKFISTSVQVPPFSTWRGRDRAGRRLSIRWAVAPLFLLDALCIVFSMAAAHYLRFDLLNYYGPYSRVFYTRLTWVAVPMWLSIFAFHRLYKSDRLFGGMREYTNVANACTAGLVGLVIYSFLNRHVEHDISRGWLAMVWFTSIASVSATRFVYRRLIYYLRRQGLFIRRALVVGANEEGRAVAAQLRASPSAGVEVVGFVEPALYQGPQVEGLPVLSGLNRLESLIRSLEVEELIVIPTALQREDLLSIYRDWGTDSRVRISLSSGLYELFTTGAHVREVGFVPMMSLNRTRITELDALMKATLDYVGALVGVVLLSPLFTLIGLLIRLDSSGPVIHRRRVVGLYGQRFDAFKFRTMIPDADAYLEAHSELMEEWERTGKIEDDPRITRVGRVLRRFSLDELPQLFNVLRGQMSLVGPRMIIPAELKHFRKWRHNLLTVKPGMTGLWQVSGRSDLSYEERVRMDMQYIRNYTIWQDLKLLLSTFRTVFGGKGAY